MQDIRLFDKYKCYKEYAKLCNGSFCFIKKKKKISNTSKHAAMYIGSGYHSFMVDIREKCNLKVGI